MSKIRSSYAMLDVKSGRKSLLRRVEAGETVRVLIRGTITDVYGRDDGVSQEFNVDVYDVEEELFE